MIVRYGTSTFSKPLMDLEYAAITPASKALLSLLYPPVHFTLPHKQRLFATLQPPNISHLTFTFSTPHPLHTLSPTASPSKNHYNLH
jgi:hypothetical protein